MSKKLFDNKTIRLMAKGADMPPGWYKNGIPPCLKTFTELVAVVARAELMTKLRKEQGK